MKIQIPNNCIFYKRHENMNKTCKNEKRCRIFYDEVCNELRRKKMKEAILIALLLTMIFWFNSIDKKLDKLIELNTPEYINVIPEEVIVER